MDADEIKRLIQQLKEATAAADRLQEVIDGCPEVDTMHQFINAVGNAPSVDDMHRFGTAVRDYLGE